ncbi:aldo/keto reductase [Candidatus Microgenomates bacterium]|jgi:predicted aldo/keto reductase-like oxidoreductase|nr:MAG: aldo/keto reductase [Candidatus Microgenomates bacterium]
MKYRSFGKLEYQPSALGFGAMRLPVLGDPPRIDEEKAIKMIHRSIEGGVNYIDTAFPYHKGESEILVGKALKGQYRKRVKLATKLPSWLVEDKADFDKFLNKQLEKLQTDHIDFYLLHSLDKEKWQNLNRLSVFSWAEKAEKDGRIGHLGFSFHDQYEVFKEIVDGYDKWTFCQIQLNYMDEDFQAGKRGLKYASQKGLAVVVMEPLKGGRLANPPEAVKNIFESAGKKTPVDWALGWVWSHPEVSLLLSGMSSLDQVEENLAIADRSAANSLTERDLKIIKKAKEKYLSFKPVPCTGCEYCLPCPQAINIPKIFEIYNDAVMYGNLKQAKEQYQRLNGVENCLKCFRCEKLCPQGIKITEQLKKAQELLA